MKKLYITVITFIILFSTLSSQDRNLEMPASSKKINVKVWNIEDSDLVRKNDILSKAKLRLRRNGIEYHISPDDDFSVGTLYIDILLTGDGDDYAGTLQLYFLRSNFFHFGDLIDFETTFNDMIVMNKPNLMGVKVYSSPTTVFSGGRKHMIDSIDEYLYQFLDNFSAEYIDANNL
tara:strand:- start:3214 stop:3741 length:528 start_codon:yes stop_codon:yes gene_type:complete